MNRHIRRIAVTATLALATLTPACHNDSNTITGVGAPAPTPGPSVHGDLGGDWFGTFTTDDEADCHSGDTHVVLAQSGERITGTVGAVFNSCGFGGTLDLTLSNGRVHGALSPGGSYRPGTVDGSASSTEMHLTISDMPTPPGPNGTGALIPGGRLDLHR